MMRAFNARYVLDDGSRGIVTVLAADTFSAHEIVHERMGLDEAVVYCSVRPAHIEPLRPLRPSTGACTPPAAA